MRGKKKQIVEEAKKIIDEYSTRLTVRQIYYRLVAKLIIANNIYQYQAVVKALRDARLQGLIRYEDIEDRTREFIGGDRGFETPEDYFRSAKSYFENCWKYYRLPKWKNQPNYVDRFISGIKVWLEKQALAALFEQVTNRWHVRLAPCKGYPSLTFLWEGAQFLNRIEDRAIHILYFGDMDASGLDIPRYVKETLQRIFNIEVNFKRVAITKEQIEQYNIPPMPAKHSDSRTPKFIAEYGEVSAVELDALEPNILQTLIGNSIAELFDDSIGHSTEEEETQLRQKIKQWIDGR